MSDSDIGVRESAPDDWRDEWASDDDLEAARRVTGSTSSEVISLTRDAVEHALEEFPAENDLPGARTAVHDWVVQTPAQPVPIFELRPATSARMAAAPPAEIPFRAAPVTASIDPRPHSSRRGIMAAGAVAAVILCVVAIGYRSSLFPVRSSPAPQPQPLSDPRPSPAAPPTRTVTSTPERRAETGATSGREASAATGRPSARNASPSTTSARPTPGNAPALTTARGRTSAVPAAAGDDPTTAATLAKIRTEATDRAARAAEAAASPRPSPSLTAPGPASVSNPPPAVSASQSARANALPATPAPVGRALSTSSAPSTVTSRPAPSAVGPAAPPAAPAPAAALPAAPPAAVPAPATAARPTDRQAIDGVLSRYQAAFSQLSSGAAQSVWPSVDARALERAFGQLDSQTVAFNSCSVSVIGPRATARCSGVASYVPKVGNRSPRSEQRQWVIDLRKTGERWLIAAVDSQ